MPATVYQGSGSSSSGGTLSSAILNLAFKEDAAALALQKHNETIRKNAASEADTDASREQDQSQFDASLTHDQKQLQQRVREYELDAADTVFNNFLGYQNQQLSRSRFNLAEEIHQNKVLRDEQQYEVQLEELELSIKRTVAQNKESRARTLKAVQETINATGHTTPINELFNEVKAAFNYGISQADIPEEKKEAQLELFNKEFELYNGLFNSELDKLYTNMYDKVRKAEGDSDKIAGIVNETKALEMGIRNTYANLIDTRYPDLLSKDSLQLLQNEVQRFGIPVAQFPDASKKADDSLKSVRDQMIALPKWQQAEYVQIAMGDYAHKSDGISRMVAQGLKRLAYEARQDTPPRYEPYKRIMIGLNEDKDITTAISDMLEYPGMKEDWAKVDDVYTNFDTKEDFIREYGVLAGDFEELNSEYDITDSQRQDANYLFFGVRDYDAPGSASGPTDGSILSIIRDNVIDDKKTTPRFHELG